MPKKAFQDGLPATREDAEKIAVAWESHDSLREAALQGQKLLVDRLGKPVVLPNLGNIAKNVMVLQEVALSMKARKRLSSDPIESLVVSTLAWYSKFQASFSGIKDFSVQVWAFRDAWVMHKMFTMLRGKVVRPEKPKDPCLSLGSLAIFLRSPLVIVHSCPSKTSTSPRTRTPPRFSIYCCSP